MKQVIVITVEERSTSPSSSTYRKLLLGSLKQACANNATNLDIKMMVEKVTEQEVVGHDSVV